MRLWLLRHGEAEPRSASDAARELTAHGRNEVQQAADELASIKRAEEQRAAWQENRRQWGTTANGTAHDGYEQYDEPEPQRRRRLPRRRSASCRAAGRPAAAARGRSSALPALLLPGEPGYLP